MKYSLRSLMIVVLVLPPVIGVAIWSLIPPVTPRGTAADMETFLRVVHEPYCTEIYKATDNCFIVGAPANRYKAILDKGDRVKPSDSWRPVGTQYEFWCEGKDYRKEGDHFVVVVVGGTPPTILYAKVDGVLK